MNDRRRAAARVLALATAIAILLMAARRLDTLPNGLRGQYFPNPDWSGAPSKTALDASPSTDAIAAATLGAAPQSFSATWTGWIVAPRDDVYTFATTSDDGSWVYVDGDLVVDNGGAHAPATRTGPTVRLSRGPHAVFIRYFQSGGGVELEWLWQRGSGRFEPVPSWALRPRRIEYGRFVVDRALEIGAYLAAWAWAVTAAVVLASVAAPAISAARRELTAEGSARWLAAIVCGSAVLNVVGLWWGVPGGTWAGDELIPQMVMSGWSQHFSHGWWDKYPPLHYLLLTMAYQPALAIDSLFHIDPVAMEALLMVTGRLLSVVMAAGTVAATFFVARRAFGARAGLFGAAIVALSAPFVYYAKAANVDVPYMFWFALSLIFYMRILQGEGRESDWVGWGITAACAVCTKDQAYALYLLMPVPVIVEIWRRRAAIVRPAAAAAVAAAATFALADNLVFNAPGFATHFETITGHASRGYRAFDPTLGGRLALLATTLHLVPLSYGWPLAVVCGAGTIAALARRDRRRVAIWLLVPAVSYYVGFVNFVLYNYDRFLLPVFVVLAAFGGYALDLATLEGTASRLRRAAAALVFAYAIVYSATVDALMLKDSRYTVERWLRRHVGEDDRVGVTSIATYMPRLSGIDTFDVPDVDALRGMRPRFVLLNPDYTLIEPADSPLGKTIATLRAGDIYRLAFCARSANPFAWLPGGNADLAGDRRDPEIVSFLRNINPTIEVYERTANH